MNRESAHVDHRVVKIVDEILCFLYSLKASNIKMEMDMKETCTELSFSAKIKEPIEDKRLQKIKKLLSSPRAHELEEYYWVLTGNDMTPSTELSLVGMMIDSYIIEYEDGSEDFFIKLVRKSEFC